MIKMDQSEKLTQNSMNKMCKLTYEVRKSAVSSIKNSMKSEKLHWKMIQKPLLRTLQ